MTPRALTCSAIAIAIVTAASVASSQAPAPRGSAAQLEALAKKATPRLAAGKTDFNGTWDHLGGIEFVRPQKQADGSVCFIACGPPPKGAPAAPFPPVQTDFPKYKPEFLSKVKELSTQQVKHDTVLQCQP